ncbi:MAG: DUF1080 domain-containing protein [Thermoguttaceae bacterium]|jgi:hypothetical protein|nr:DUF1080 domain-containing protein [Thermoguttaceae bacterium]
MKRTFWSTVSIVLAATACLAAEKQARVFTDPGKAGPDFPLQGEYLGNVKTDTGEVPVGVQVIALGDGKFRAVGYPGGLPGAGGDPSQKAVAEGQLQDGAVRFAGPETMTAVLKDNQITVRQGDQLLGTLKKTERKSPTLGAKPPAGAIVLFDGTSGDQFTPGKTDGDLLTQGNNSKRKFQSFHIHLEFRTPFQPFDRGQARGNSGFYAQGRYEVQILDSFGLEGEDNECGGIYRVARPAVNMCFPPLAWQTYDIDFTAAEYQDGKKVKNARMTVRHNGVVIHENVEVPHATVAAILKEGPEPGPIHLQDHGNPVRFRNIWVVEK